MSVFSLTTVELSSILKAQTNLAAKARLAVHFFIVTAGIILWSSNSNRGKVIEHGYDAGE